MNSIDDPRLQPLNSLRIVVTRAESSDDKLTTLLRSAGAEPIEYPTIAFATPTEEQLMLLDTALRAACKGAYDWLLLTSITGVRFVAERLAVLGLRPDELRGLQVGAVGPATAHAIQEQLGLEVACVPERFIAEELAAALGEVTDTRILICAADLARAALGDTLEQAGACVTRAVAYRTIPATGGPDIPQLLKQGGVDAITFGSGSAARSFVTRIGPEVLVAANRALIACIGPVTAEAAQDVGLQPDVVAETLTMEGLVQCLISHYHGASPSSA